MQYLNSNPLSGLRILVVEDDLLIAMDMEATLEEFGCRVVGPCERLDKALAAADETIDGAIVDMNLRGEYSFPLIEKLRGKGIPTVVCSGYVDLPDIKLRLKDVPMLPKPCATDKLLEIMKRTFVREQRRPQAAAN